MATLEESIAQIDALLEKQQADFNIQRVEAGRVERVKRVTEADDPLVSVQDALDKKIKAESEGAGFLTGVKRRMFREDVPPGKSKAVEEARLNAVIALSTAGTILGSRVPVAPGAFGFVINPFTGAFVLGGAGAIAGTVAPETSMELAEAAGLIPEGTREKFGRSETELAVMTKGEVGLELMTGAIGQFPRVVARPMVRSSTGASKLSSDLAEFGSAKLKVDLLPFQAGEQGSIAQAVLNVAGRFPILGAPARGPVFLAFLRSISGQRQVRGQALEAVKTLSGKIGDVSTFPDLSHAILGDAQNLLSATLKKFGLQYDAVFALAKKSGVRVNPKQMRKAASEILQSIVDRSAISQTGKRVLSGANKQLSEFLTGPNVKGLNQVQTLKSYDGAIQTLDEFIKTAHNAKLPGIIIADLNKLRNAMLTDITTNIFGRNAKAIGIEMRAIDSAYSGFLSSIFETSVAKKFGRVQKKGLRGAKFDPTTTTAIDGLAQHVLELNQPQAINELLNLMTLKTAKRVAATVVEQGLNKSLSQGAKAGEFVFNLDAAKTFFGFADKSSGRLQAMTTLLKRTGSPFTIDDMRNTIEVFARVQSFNIADASTFVQRRLVLTGIAAGATFGILNNFEQAGPFAVGALLFGLIGARGFARAVSNPAGAKAWRQAIRAETSLGNKRSAALRVLRFALTPEPDEIARAALTGDELGTEDTEAASIFEQGKELITELTKRLAEKGTSLLPTRELVQ